MVDNELLFKHFHRQHCSCGAQIGETHAEGCDVARCRKCGIQAIQCFDHQNKKWKSDVWTGWWPGTVEAIQLDLWCYWGPDFGQHGWVKCSSDHPGARPDLNELAIYKFNNS